VRVNGPDAAPVYKFLKASKLGLFGSARIKWNFTKFLVDKNGKVIERYGTSTAPMSIEVPPSFPLSFSPFPDVCLLFDGLVFSSTLQKDVQKALEE
jgi:glutathione peroxidase